jgi:integrase
VGTRRAWPGPRGAHLLGDHWLAQFDKLASALHELKRRGHHTARRDHVFVSRFGTELDGSMLRRRHIAARDAAGLRPLRFHDLRHTFASVAINTQVQAWMGHADVKTTMRYLHHKSHADDARRLSAAFNPGDSEPPLVCGRRPTWSA